MNTLQAAPFLNIAGQIINHCRTFPDSEPAHLILVCIAVASFIKTSQSEGRIIWKNLLQKSRYLHPRASPLLYMFS